jgi:hypothetical protein
VPYTAISDEAYFELKRDGVPDFVAKFVLKWVQGMNAGEWQDQTGDLETLIGRKPKTAAELFRDDYLPGEGGLRKIGLVGASAVALADQDILYISPRFTSLKKTPR